MRVTGRERVLEAAYELFSRGGVEATGIDAVIAEAGVAKMTLYRNFGSKEALALAFLEERNERWTNGWFLSRVEALADTPAGKLLAIFDVFGEWFEEDGYQGCPFINVLLEQPVRENPVRQAAAGYLANNRSIIAELAAEAGVADPDEVAHQWHILMKGAIISAVEGDPGAARRARGLAELVLRAHGALE